MSERIQRYESDRIAVTFDPDRCLHTGRCVAGLPAVFDIRRKRWIAPEDGVPNEIADVVRGCPSGALRYERLDGGQPEAPERPTRFQVVRGGPLYVRGEIELTGPDGERIDVGPRAAFCRCGQSKNKPFCDNSHREAGFEG